MQGSPEKEKQRKFKKKKKKLTNKCRKHTTLEVTATGCNELRVGMPVNTQDSGLVLFNHFGNPPIVILFVVTNWHTFGATGNSKFFTVWGPFDVEGCSVNAKNYQRWLPLCRGVVVGPDKSISIVTAGDNLVGNG